MSLLGRLFLTREMIDDAGPVGAAIAEFLADVLDPDRPGAALRRGNARLCGLVPRCPECDPWMWLDDDDDED